MYILSRAWKNKGVDQVLMQIKNQDFLLQFLCELRQVNYNCSKAEHLIRKTLYLLE